MKLCCELTFSICITSRQLYTSYMKYYTHHTSSKCVLTSFSINQSRGSVRSRGTNANRYDLRKIPSTSSSSDAWSGRQICPRHTQKREKATQSKQTVATTGLKGIGPYFPSCPYTDLERSTNPIASFPPLTVLQLIHAGCAGRGKAEYFIILSGSLLPSYCGRYSELLFAIGHSKSSSCISFSQRQQFGRFVLFFFFLVENGC